MIQNRDKRQLPRDDGYRQLSNPDMSLRSYAKLYPNDGAMTPGTTEETVDGWSMEKVAASIVASRDERWRWTPVQRVLIDKPKGGKRPLGLPVWSDKVVQAILRSLLEAYDAPPFSKYSHGFRPTRGCHTALHEGGETWTGTKWFIEGDIKGCVEKIDHTILRHILRENIQDNRCLRLIEGALKGGDCEAWTYHPTLSGSPQGGIVTLLTKLQTWC
jgi:retron-type reverse transcriptase